MDSNKLYNYFNGEGYLASQYWRLEEVHYSLKGLFQQVDEMIYVFEKFWSDGENYWLPLIQQLRFDEITIPQHIDSYNFQCLREQLNDSICTVVEEFTYFSHVLRPHAPFIPRPPEWKNQE